MKGYNFMIREKALKLLKEYSPSLEESNYKEVITNFINKNERCFDRKLDAGHITSSAWLLSRCGNKALLMHHAKLNLWMQLGGHCDNDGDILQVAVKEAIEESGINHIEPVSNNIFDIDIHYIPANQKEAAHYHYDIRFLLQIKSNEKVKINHESKELRWIGKYKSELPTSERSVVRMFEKWLAYNI